MLALTDAVVVAVQSATLGHAIAAGAAVAWGLAAVWLRGLFNN